MKQLFKHTKLSGIPVKLNSHNLCAARAPFRSSRSSLPAVHHALKPRPPAQHNAYYHNLPHPNSPTFTSPTKKTTSSHLPNQPALKPNQPTQHHTEQPPLNPPPPAHHHSELPPTNPPLPPPSTASYLPLN